MKTLYLDCQMGAAGDMLTAALLEIHPDPQGALHRLNQLGLPGIVYRAEKTGRCGITGTHMHVTVDGIEESPEMHAHSHEHADVHTHHDDHIHEQEHDHVHEQDHNHVHEAGQDLHHDHGHDHDHVHTHTGMAQIRHIISHADLPQKVREDVLAVYALIAQAESTVHGRTVEEIHFHEVGSMDAVADVTAVCYLMHELAPEKVYASPVAVGSGSVRCAHGILPVPAPATAQLLTGVPTYAGAVTGELCTPTGAALLRYFVMQFGEQPLMRADKIGYGCGTKDFPQANVVRAVYGNSTEESTQGSRTGSVLEISCNLDDICAEKIGFAMDRLLEAGALDVYTTSIGMKKNRPGVMLSCLCREADRDRMLRLLFQHTTTIGVRMNRLERYMLDRQMDTVQTRYGDVRVKTSQGFGVSRQKPEYEDLAQIALREDLSIAQAEEAFFEAAKKS